ncbi:hypothetical protein Tco_0973883 [Tanacetum coccineum]|uniref:Reverse transcriptase domain-containing protein n=1 Tax=Tanacetum coccineum TaxID=301880 RepID=A0ABQ5EA35_9ASTR
MALLPPDFLEPLYPDMINAQDIEHIIPPILPRDTEPPVGSPISLSPSLSVGSSSPVRSTTPPPDYPFDESIFAELDNSLWIIPRPLGSEPVPEEPNKSDAFADSVAAALEAQAATMTNIDYTNRNTGPRETTDCSKKINCTEDCKVKFATGTLTEEALSWWNSFAQPIRIEETYKIPCFEFKNLLIYDEYCPDSEELEMLCPTMRYAGNLLCVECNLHPHRDLCTGPSVRLATRKKGYSRNQCSKANNSALGRAFMPRDKNAHQDLNVVTAVAFLRFPNVDSNRFNACERTQWLRAPYSICSIKLREYLTTYRVSRRGFIRKYRVLYSKIDIRFGYHQKTSGQGNEDFQIAVQNAVIVFIDDNSDNLLPVISRRKQADHLGE